MHFSLGTGAMGQRNFQLYIVGNSFSSMGLWVQKLATSWLAWTLSHSEMWVGLVAFASFAPTLILSAPFGVLIDRCDIRRTSLVINVLLMLLAAVLAACSWSGLLKIELLFALALATGVVSAAYAPTRLALVPSLVPREMLPSAVAINAFVFNISRLIGPAIAGLILATSNASWAFTANALSFVPFIFALSMLRIDSARGPSLRTSTSFWAEMVDGFSYARGNRYIYWQLLLTASMASFGRAVLELQSVYADAFYHAGASGLALLATVSGLGALASALLCSRLDLRGTRILRATMRLGLLSGFALLLLPIVNNLTFGLACMGVIGFAATGSSIISQTGVQLEVDNAMRARISSLWGMASLGGAAVGSLLLGWLQSLIGILWSTEALALASTIVPAFAWWHIRRDTSALNEL